MSQEHRKVFPQKLQWDFRCTNGYSGRKFQCIINNNWNHKVEFLNQQEIQGKFQVHIETIIFGKKDQYPNKCTFTSQTTSIAHDHEDYKFQISKMEEQPSPAWLTVWFHWFIKCKKWSWYCVKIGNLNKLGEINLNLPFDHCFSKLHVSFQHQQKIKYILSLSRQLFLHRTNITLAWHLKQNKLTRWLIPTVKKTYHRIGHVIYLDKW